MRGKRKITVRWQEGHGSEEELRVSWDISLSLHISSECPKRRNIPSTPMNG
jgi:hypothetical protein